MPQYEVRAHCRYYIKYHIVWIVKYRDELLIGDPIVQRLVQLLFAIGRKYEIPVKEVGADKDHLHLFCQGLPRISPAKTVEIFKSISSRELLREFPNLKRETFGAKLWGVGYYLATVGYHSNTEAVKTYVKNQGKNTKLENYIQLRIIS